MLVEPAFSRAITLVHVLKYKSRSINADLIRSNSLCLRVFILYPTSPMSSLRRQSSQSVLANTNGYLGVTQHPVQSGPLTRGRSVRARKHRTAYDDSAIQMSPAGVTMYNCREIMELILRSCDWRFLMVFSRLERYSRAIVQYVARMMLKDILCLWVEDVDGLLRLLETTGGGITGSVARMLMEVNSERMRIVSQAVGRTSICRHCHDLNIIVPTGQFPDAVAFFKQQGFSKTTFPTPDHPYVESVLRFAICQRPRSGTRPVSCMSIPVVFLQLTSFHRARSGHDK